MLAAAALYFHWAGPGYGFFGLGLEVRHVTLVTGQMAAAAASLGPQVFTEGAFWSAVLATLLVYAGFNLAVDPMDGPVGRYDAKVIAAAPAGEIAVPNGFNSQFERFQFLLPGEHHFVPYETGARRRADTPWQPEQELAQLLATHAAVVWIQHDSARTTPPCLPACQVRGERWLLTSRHLPGEVRLDNVWHPEQWLYRREWLLTQNQ